MEVSKRYAQRGVSASKGDVHNAIKNIDKGLFPKAFCKIVPDFLTNDEEYCLVMHADGAGTKSSLAYAYWKETGDLSVWKGIAQDALIMNIDDLLCVGAVDDIMLSSTIGRNKNLITSEVISAIINGTEELISELKTFGVTIHSTGGKTADVGDLVRTVIVDSTVVARMKRNQVIDNANITSGDVIVGLASFGQATSPDSGCAPTAPVTSNVRKSGSNKGRRRGRGRRAGFIRSDPEHIRQTFIRRMIANVPAGHRMPLPATVPRQAELGTSMTAQVDTVQPAARRQGHEGDLQPLAGDRCRQRPGGASGRGISHATRPSPRPARPPARDRDRCSTGPAAAAPPESHWPT